MSRRDKASSRQRYNVCDTTFATIQLCAAGGCCSQNGCTVHPVKPGKLHHKTVASERTDDGNVDRAEGGMLEARYTIVVQSGGHGHCPAHKPQEWVDLAHSMGRHRYCASRLLGPLEL